MYQNMRLILFNYVIIDLFMATNGIHKKRHRKGRGKHGQCFISINRQQQSCIFSSKQTIVVFHVIWLVDSNEFQSHPILTICSSTFRSIFSLVDFRQKSFVFFSVSDIIRYSSFLFRLIFRCL